MAFVFFLKEQKPASLKKQQKHLDFEKKTKKRGGLSQKKLGFSQPWLSFSPVFVILPRSHDLEQVPSLSVSLGVCRTPRG